MIKILIVSVVVVLAGCSTLTDIRKNYFYVTSAERLALQRDKCTEIGFKRDTVEHTNCVLELIKARAVRKTVSL